ncbi:hypothetical protein M3T53_07135 [Actinomyces sp. B33]|uniref:hypothetical protein n=1 Tax=Actinomyces sp. B33 TaxID=2942131 RepID=UPI0023412698|nr:hypothetical protein [Actinomyces sp. B33]MDC4233481.1 hypothetical protein [Actinomyces sp. B33]
MTSRNAAAARKPWWRTRTAHSAPGPGGRVHVRARGLVCADPVTGARLIDGIDLGFRSGSVTAVIDPSGRRTRLLLLALAGLTAPDAGLVRAARPHGPLASRAHQAPAVLVHPGAVLDPALTIRQSLIAPFAATGARVAWEALREAVDLTGLDSSLDALPASLPASALLRAQIARGIAAGPGLVLVDLPSPLPRAESADLFDALHRVAGAGSAVVVAVRTTGESARADRVVVLTDGRVGFDASPVVPEDVDAWLVEHPDDPVTLVGPPPVAAPPQARAPLDDEALAEEAAPAAADEIAPRATTASGPGAEAPSPTGPGAGPNAPDSDHESPADFTGAPALGVGAAPDTTPPTPPEPRCSSDESPADDADPLRDELTREHHSYRAPAAQVDEVIDRARRILSDLPGPVVPED